MKKYLKETKTRKTYGKVKFETAVNLVIGSAWFLYDRHVSTEWLNSITRRVIQFRRQLKHLKPTRLVQRTKNAILVASVNFVFLT